MSSHPLRYLALALAAALVPFAGSCASKCGSDCPPTQVLIGAQPGETLLVTKIGWVGPACPPYNPMCRGATADSCELLGIVATAPGTCDLSVEFADRPPLTVHAVFGTPSTEGCCKGFPVLSEPNILIPPLSGADAGTDATPPDDADADADAATSG